MSGALLQRQRVSIHQPIARPDGTITREWFIWLQQISQQSFVGAGGDSGSSEYQVTVNTSPYVFLANRSGTALVSGGGLTDLEISRNGSVWYTTGLFRGAFPLSANDQLRLSWTQLAPILTFFPR